MTTPFDHYIAPATGQRGFLGGLWKLPVGIAAILVGWVLAVVLVMSAVTVVYMSQGMAIPAALDAMNKTFLGGGSTIGVILALLTFSGVWLGLWLALRFLHWQPFASLFSPRGRIRWGQFAGGLLLCVPFWLVSLVLGLAIVGIPERTTMPVGLWLASLMPLAVMVFIQASAEELVFRGYILQQLAARFRSPLVWAFLPAFLFGALHYENGTALGPGMGALYVLVTVLFGLAAAAMVWRTGSLALAMGYHTGMNFLSLSLAGVSGVVDGTMLYAYDKSHALVLFSFDAAMTTLLLVFLLSPLCPWGRGNAPA